MFALKNNSRINHPIFNPGSGRKMLTMLLCFLLVCQPVWATGQNKEVSQNYAGDTSSEAPEKSPEIRIQIIPEKYAEQLLPSWAAPAHSSREADWIVEIFEGSSWFWQGSLGLSAVKIRYTDTYSGKIKTINFLSLPIKVSHKKMRSKLEKKLRSAAGDRSSPDLSVRYTIPDGTTLPAVRLDLELADDMGLDAVGYTTGALDWIEPIATRRGITQYHTTRYLPLNVGENKIVVVVSDLYGRITQQKLKIFRTQGKVELTGLRVAVDSDDTPVRKSPDKYAPIVNHVKQRYYYPLLDHVDGWYQIELPDRSRAWLYIKDGWITEGSAPMETPSGPVEYPPLLSLNNVLFSDEAGDGYLDEGEGGSLSLQVINEGKGPARSLQIRIQPDREGILIQPERLPTTVPAGGSVDVLYHLVAGAAIESGPVQIQLEALDQTSGGKSLRITHSITVRARYSDVDLNPLQTSLKKPDGIALIIGNQDYQEPGVYPVKYALRDAETVKRYVTESLGFPMENVIHSENATLSQMQSILGSQLHPAGRLHNLVLPGRSDVFVYYSGHGAPGPQAREGYLLPVDVNFADTEKNGINLNFLRESLSALKARSVTLVVDACFSGLGAQGSLLKDVSGPQIVVRDPFLNIDQGASFFAAKGDQVAYWHPLEMHGLFTYFFLQGLRGPADQNQDKKITVDELKEYLQEQVPYFSRRLDHDQPQQPVITVPENSKNMVLIKY